MPVVGAVRSGRVNFLERDIWPTTPSVQEFQPNVRVARYPDGDPFLIRTSRPAILVL